MQIDYPCLCGHKYGEHCFVAHPNSFCLIIVDPEKYCYCLGFVADNLKYLEELSVRS